jgi:hypothetical protein
MIAPILLAFLGLQQDVEQQQLQVARQTLQRIEELGRLAVEFRQQVGDLRQQMIELRQQTVDLRPALERMRTDLLNDPNSTCSAVASWQALGSTRVTDAQSPVTVLLVSMVSAPSAECLNADIRITANYFAENGGFVCSGGVTAAQAANVQNTLFEFRPMTPEYFAKWRDGPTWERSNFHRLSCGDYEGIEDRDPASRARTVKLIATVLPKRGGIATAELILSLPVSAPVSQPGTPTSFRTPGRIP